MNRGKWIWLLGAGVLALLFLMSSTDLIIEEKPVEIIPVSILIRRDGDAYYENFRKGMERAAEEFNADVNVITLYDSNSRSQQLALLERELKEGARALILEPADEESVELLEEIKPSSPVILLDHEAAGEYVTDCVGEDGRKAGEMLGAALAERVPPQVPVYLFSEGLSAGSNRLVYEGVCSVLEEKGYELRLFERLSSESCREAIEENVYPGSGRVAVAALDVLVLDELSAFLEGNEVYAPCIEGLYGVGFTNGILSRMGRQVIDGIVVSNQFDKGYLSVKRAVEAAEGDRFRSQAELELFYLEQEDLTDPRYEKMLYPIG